MKQNRLLWYVGAALLCWVLYLATFDTDGAFDPSSEWDVIEYRIGAGFGVVVDETNDTIDDTSQQMSRTARGRERRTQKQIRHDNPQ